MAQRSYPSRESANRSAPLGIKVLCGLSVVVGLFAVFGLVVVAGRYTAGLGGLIVLALGMGLLTILGVVLYGLWTLRTWAWILTVVGYAAAVLLRLVPPWNPADLTSIALTVLLLGYLFSVRGYYLGS